MVWITQRTPYIEDSNAEWDKSMALEAKKAQDEAQFAQKMQRIQNNPNSLEARMYNFGNNLKDFNLGDALLGRQAAPTDTMSADSNGLKITTSENPRIGGILRDIAGGYQENRFTPASLENLGQNTLEGGRQKGFAYKLGEGLGSIARLANSPLGRGLIVGGLVTATGGNPLQALAYGGGATMLNQQNVLRDRVYRNDIVNSETQRIMNDTSLTDDQKENAIEQLQNQVSAYRGYMTPEVYSNLIHSQQLRDNAAYRKMYFDVNQANMQANREYQRQQDALDRAYQERAFDYKKQQDAIDNKIALANLEAKRTGAQGKPLSDTQVKDIKNLTDSLNDIDRIITKYSDSKYDAGFGLLGAARRNPLTSKIDPLATEMRQDIDMFRKSVAKAREGGRLTDQDQKYYEKALMNPNLSRKDFLALDKEFENTVKLQRDTALDMYELQGKDVSNFRNYYENKTNRQTSSTTSTGSQSTNNQSIQVGNYKVRVK